MATPPPPPLPDENTKIKIPTSLEELDKDWFEVDFASGTAADVNALDWDKAIGFTMSSEGSEGVIFVQFEDKSIVTLKGSSTQAADVFAQYLASLVGIAIPDFRILKSGEKEHEKLKERMDELDEKNNPLVRGKHTKPLERPVISIIEFIKGKNLYELDPSDIFGKSSISVRGANFCKEIAKITTYDMVINNWDRIPLIWDNKGNPENILFTTSHKRKELFPFAIDNTITSIDPSLEENFSEYMDKVRYVINEVCRAWNQPPVFRNVRETFSVTSAKPPSIMKVREFFKSVFQGQYDIGDPGMRYFTIGFVATTQEFAKVSRADLDELLANVEKLVEKACENTSLDPEVAGLQKINLDFVDGVLQIFREAAPTLEKVQQSMEHAGYPTE
eukprot:Phypoly_transcript_09156.p1 GENE.Phypoly_transcript_09156~~Phypoly_transcript_09156.p1  ORF type:complete len:389 (+),score=89.44 Phypoly_transcript_09156:158-1324(+)